MSRFAVIAAYFGSVLGVTIGMYLYAIEAWLAPFEPVLYLGVFIVIAFSLMSAFWLHSTKQVSDTGRGTDGMSAEEVGFKRLTELAGQFTLGCVALLVMLTWAIPDVRALWVGYIENNNVQLGYAIEDPSPKVISRSCRAMFDQGVGPWRGRLAERLAEFPTIAPDCIDYALKNQRGSASVVAATTTRIWTVGLIRSTEYESFDACDKTDALMTVEGMLGRSAEIPLLECAFLAHSSTARECCAERSDSLEPLLAVANSNSLQKSSIQKLLPQIVQGAFSPNEDQAEVAEMMSLNEEAAQKTAMMVACALLEQSDDQEIAEVLSDAIAGGDCVPIDANVGALLSKRSWTSICIDIESGRPTTQKEMCAALNEINVDIAIAAAQVKVSAAASAHNRKSFADEMSGGMRQAAAMGGGQKKKIEPRLLENAAAALELPSTNDASCRVMMSDSYHAPGVLQFNLNMRIVETTDCERIDPNISLWQYQLDQRKKRRDERRLAKEPFAAKNADILKKRVEKTGRNLNKTNVRKGQRGGSKEYREMTAKFKNKLRKKK